MFAVVTSAGIQGKYPPVVSNLPGHVVYVCDWQVGTGSRLEEVETCYSRNCDM